MKFPNIEAERIKRELDKDQFSRTLGVTRRTISNWQSGKTEIPVSKLIVIADMFHCSTDYLLGLTTEPEGKDRTA